MVYVLVKNWNKVYIYYSIEAIVCLWANPLGPENYNIASEHSNPSFDFNEHIKPAKKPQIVSILSEKMIALGIDCATYEQRCISEGFWGSTRPRVRAPSIYIQICFLHRVCVGVCIHYIYTHILARLWICAIYICALILAWELAVRARLIAYSDRWRNEWTT